MSKKKTEPEGLQTVHWKALKTNPYVQPLAAQMLNKDGFLIKKKVKLKGSTQYDEPEEVLVHYDSEYFDNKLEKTFEGLFLEGMSNLQVLKIVEDSLTRYLAPSSLESEDADNE